ncbi:MAG: MMPL family transporter [Pseudonocardiaceae bacterium]
MAALLPLALAGAGLLTTFGVITVLTGWIAINQFVIAFVTMIGLGVGIDYAMFVVSRFREEVRRRGGPQADRVAVADAVGAAMATSGRTIAAAGAIVVVSLWSLFVVQAPLFRALAAGAAMVVAVTLTAAWTLLPAALAALGPRVERGSLPRRWQPADARSDADAVRGGWSRWATVVMRRPGFAAGPAIVALAAATAPGFGMSFGLDLGVRALYGRPTGHAQQVLVEQFSPGAVAPIRVVVPDGARDPAAVAELTRRL